MLDPSVVRLLHRHGDNSWARLEPSSHHSPAEHDPEREWLRKGRLFRCTTCEEEVIVLPPGDERPVERG